MGGAQKVLRARRALQVVYNPQVMNRFPLRIHRRKTPLGGRWFYKRSVLYDGRERVRRWALRVCVIGGALGVLYEWLAR